MFTEVLQKLFYENNTNANQMCRAIGLSKSAVSKWFQRDTVPSGDVLTKIAEYFNVSVDYLLERDSDKGEITSVTYEVLGKISAGYEGEAVEMKTGESVTIPKDMLKGHMKDDFFMLEVQGMSMYPKFLPKDKVMVLRTPSVDSGATAVVMYNSTDATIKRVEYGEGFMDLIPCNPEYETKHVTGENLNDCRVLGKVVKLIRDIL